jgi:scyllo-inositol 2-dehydrogenase (NADP+)
MKLIKTALCSYGMSGVLFHAPFINAHPGFDFYAVLERSKNQAKERYPAVKVFRNFEDMIADEEIELVIVNTPNNTHFDYTKQALQAGKHVICEKPFTVSASEAEELIQLAATVEKKLSIFHNRRFDSDFKTVQYVLNGNLLGDIVEAEFHFDRFKEELSPKLHKETPGKGTGALYDLGSHLIDQALFLFGMPVSVFADIVIMRPISKVDDYFELLLYYPTSRVRLRGSYQVKEALPGYILHGRKGSFIKTKADVQEEQLQSGKSPIDQDYGIESDTNMGFIHTEFNGEILKKHVTTLNGNYMDYFEGVFNYIRHDAPNPVRPEEGKNVIQILEAAFKSSDEKKVIDL